MTLTRKGIAYNFYKSPYELKINYKNFNLIFRFSSKKNIDKFLNKQEDNRKTINTSLTKRFKMSLTFDLIADLKLYSLIETRGFLILKESENFECLEEVEFDGQMMTKKNLQD